MYACTCNVFLHSGKEVFKKRTLWVFNQILWTVQMLNMDTWKCCRDFYSFFLSFWIILHIFTHLKDGKHPAYFWVEKKKHSSFWLLILDKNQEKRLYAYFFLFKEIYWIKFHSTRRDHEQKQESSSSIDWGDYLMTLFNTQPHKSPTLKQWNKQLRLFVPFFRDKYYFKNKKRLLNCLKPRKIYIYTSWKVTSLDKQINPITYIY